MELDELWLGLGLFKEFNMAGGTHQLNGLFNFFPHKGIDVKM